MTQPPLRRQVLVQAPPAEAYRLFIDDIGSWWPLGSHGCFGAEASLARDGDELVETAPSGERAVWGTITHELEAASIAFTWHPGGDAASASAVEVQFAPSGAGTLVTLVHTGWEVYADPAATRGSYAGGWLTVLGDYADAATWSFEDGQTWLILEHDAGPATPAGGVFSSPDFPKHLAFLRSLADRGALIAGGPLPDTAGGGMTIVRASGFAAAREIVTAAQLDDGAVAAGLLDVRVRPWHVAMAAV